MARRIQTYAEFWPFYVGEHRKPATRWFHFVGTQLGILFALSGFTLHTGWTALAFPVTSYAFAWFSHFAIEKNKPATFTYPVWSLISDFRMLGLMWTGRMGKEAARILKPATA